MVGTCAFRRFASLLLQEANLFVRRRRQSSDTQGSRERCRLLVIASASEAIQSGLRKRLDCFVAIAPRNDEAEGDARRWLFAIRYSLFAIRYSPLAPLQLRRRTGARPPQRKGQFDVLRPLLEMSLDRSAHDLGQCSQWLFFIELGIRDSDGQQTPIFPFEPDRRLDPGHAFEIALDRFGVFPSFDQRADHAAGGKT